MTFVIPIGDARSTEPTVANAAALPVASAEYLDQVRITLDDGAAHHCHDPGGGIAWVQIAGSGGGPSRLVSLTAGAQAASAIPLTVQVTEGGSPASGVFEIGLNYNTGEMDDPPGDFAAFDLQTGVEVSCLCRQFTIVGDLRYTLGIVQLETEADGSLTFDLINLGSTVETIVLTLTMVSDGIMVADRLAVVTG